MVSDKTTDCCRSSMREWHYDSMYLNVFNSPHVKDSNVVSKMIYYYLYLVTSFGHIENLTVANWWVLPVHEIVTYMKIHREWCLYLGLSVPSQYLSLTKLIRVSSVSAFSVQAYYARQTHLRMCQAPIVIPRLTHQRAACCLQSS